jgi:hypothetical protein
MYIKISDMQVLISADRMIRDIQEDFSRAYPYLKIEFFRNGSVRKERYPSSLLLPTHTRVRDAWTKLKSDGELSLDDNMSVADLENAFIDQFGLSVQVFRRSGNIWLETTMTDRWTLRQQNDHGKEISETLGA